MPNSDNGRPRKPVVPEHLVRQALTRLREKSTQLCDSQLVVEPQLFTSREVARIEQERVFGRVPMIVAHASEVAAPGDFIAKRLPNNDQLETDARRVRRQLPHPFRAPADRSQSNSRQHLCGRGLRSALPLCLAAHESGPLVED